MTQSPPVDGAGRRRRPVVALATAGVLLVAALVAVLLVRAASGDGPDDVARAYFEAVQDDDCAAVARLGNAALGVDDEGDRDDALDDATATCESSGLGTEGGAGCDLDVTGTEVDGDTAVVSFDVVGCDDDLDESQGSELPMVREDGEWRVGDLATRPSPEGPAAGAAAGPGDAVLALQGLAADEDCAALELFSNAFVGVSSEAGRDAAVAVLRADCEEAGGFESDGPGCRTEIVDESVVRDRATVTYDVVGCDDPDRDDAGEGATLVREQGRWRVDGI